MVRAWVYLPTRILAKVVLSPIFSLQVEQKRNLPDHQGVVLLPKHQRWEDIPLLGLAVPRPLHYVAKHELFETALQSRYLRALGGIPLNRMKPIRSKRSFKEIREILAVGGTIVVFPEGTYYPGLMGPLRAGMIRFLLKWGEVPFVPVGIAYKKSMLRTRVRIRFGSPMLFKNYGTEQEFIRDVSEKIAFLSCLRH
ncbi:MAG: hypothetical protein DRH15_02915 [Deltaproteobacteria bacterium]|nr:MAG: hypothetical protein DRH15_02915 [Deltaproteobacteria bacterium]